MYKPFFPDPAFGWVYYLALIGFVSIASYTDLRRMVVPKWLTIAGVILGLLLNVMRGLLLGMQDLPVWVLPAGEWIGALDGLLYALSGFLVGFGLFFVFWLFGICGGGDVKLFGALGGWVGPYMVLYVYTGSILVLIVLVVLWFVSRTAMGKKPTRLPTQSTKQGTKAGERKEKPPKLRFTYSFPVAVATAVIILWMLRVDLHLAPPKETPPQKAQAHASQSHETSPRRRDER